MWDLARRRRLDRVRDAYTVRFRAHGETHQGVLWKSAAAQTLRFERLLDILSDHPMGRPMTINDLGCGWGALFEHIARAPHLPPLAAYRGYDICPDMVMAARKRTATTMEHEVDIKNWEKLPRSAYADKEKEKEADNWVSKVKKFMGG